MPTVDDIAVLLNQALDPDVISAVVGAAGRELPSDHDPGHPEDEGHYFVVPARGLQMLSGPDRIVRTLFFMLEGTKRSRRTLGGFESASAASRAARTCGRCSGSRNDRGRRRGWHRRCR